MSRDLDTLMDVIEAAWPFTPEYYAILRATPDEAYEMMRGRHVALHLVKESAKLVSIYEKLDHHGPALTIQQLEQERSALRDLIICTLRYARARGYSGWDLEREIEVWRAAPHRP